MAVFINIINKFGLNFIPFHIKKNIFLRFHGLRFHIIDKHVINKKQSTHLSATLKRGEYYSLLKLNII